MAGSSTTRVIHADGPPDVSLWETGPEAAAWVRLEDQLGWYEAQAAAGKRWFQTLKVIQLLASAAIPVVVAAGGSAVLAGVLGALIVALEGIQQLFQFQQNWTSYRGTAEALKHEKFLFLAGADVYADRDRRTAQLAERVEGLVSREHAAWASSRRQAATQTVKAE